MSEIATRVATYRRISKDRLGDEHGVENQDADINRFADGRALTIVGRFCDNDISASKGLRRPDYIAMMGAAARREFDAILVWQTSRLWRSRKERAEAIETLKVAGVSVIAVKGPSLDMSTAYGRGMAELLGAFDTMEVEVKAERQQLAAEQAARNGKRTTACPRPFGFEADHVTHRPAEANAIREAARAIVGGSSVTAVARRWEEQGLRPSRAPFGPLPANAWSLTSVKDILRNPRIAGLNAYRKEEVGPGNWEPIVPETTWRAVVAILDDPARKPTMGVTTFLGGIVKCRCGNIMTAGRDQHGSSIYRCVVATRTQPGPHMRRASAPVDDLVERLIVARLSLPDIAELVAPKSDADVPALNTEAASIRRNLDELAADRALGLLTRTQLIVATERGNARLAAIAAELAAATSDSVLSPFMAGKNARKVWDSLDRPRQRAVVRFLCDVIVHPAVHGSKVFNPDTVDIKWHHGA